MRLSRTLVVAVAAHLAALAWMSRAPAERTTPSTDGHAMELDVEPLVNSAMRRVDGGTPSTTALGKIVGAVTDPLDTAVALAAHEPLVRVVKARVLDVQAF